MVLCFSLFCRVFVGSRISLPLNPPGSKLSFDEITTIASHSILTFPPFNPFTQSSIPCTAAPTFYCPISRESFYITLITTLVWTSVSVLLGDFQPFVPIPLRLCVQPNIVQLVAGPH